MSSFTEMNMSTSKEHKKTKRIFEWTIQCYQCLKEYKSPEKLFNSITHQLLTLTIKGYLNKYSYGQKIHISITMSQLVILLPQNKQLKCHAI